MNLYLKPILLIFLLLAGTQAYASAKSEAEKLVVALELDQSMDRGMENMLAIQMRQNPNLAPFKDVMLKFLRKHMSYKSLKPDLIRIYSEAFTEPELKEINAFYRTDVGKKAIRLMPELVNKGGQLGAQRVRENLPELQQMIQAEAARIQQRQSKAN